MHLGDLAVAGFTRARSREKSMIEENDKGLMGGLTLQNPEHLNLVILGKKSVGLSITWIKRYPILMVQDVKLKSFLFQYLGWPPKKSSK